MANITIILLTWESICGIIATLIAILGAMKHNKKKTSLTKLLMYALFAFALAIITQTIGTYMHEILFIDISGDAIESGNLILNWQYFLLEKLQYSQLFTLTGTFFLYLFSQKVFSKEQKKVINLIHYIFLAFNWIIFGAMGPIFGVLTSDLFNVSYFLMAYAFIVMIPMLVHCIQLLPKIANDEKIRHNIKFLTLMTVTFVLTFICFALETLLPGTINIFSFVAWSCMLFVLISTYQGFFKAKA